MRMCCYVKYYLGLYNSHTVHIFWPVFFFRLLHSNQQLFLWKLQHLTGYISNVCHISWAHEPTITFASSNRALKLPAQQSCLYINNTCHAAVSWLYLFQHRSENLWRESHALLGALNAVLCTRVCWGKKGHSGYSTIQFWIPSLGYNTPPLSELSNKLSWSEWKLKLPLCCSFC